MNGAPQISSEQTVALVVGIESYPRRQGLDLDGPADDALKIARWLRDRGVPAENIKVLLSANEAKINGAELNGVSLFNGLVNIDAVTTALETFRRSTARFIFIFWTGHGIMTPDGVRRPLLANYSDSDTHNLNIESLQEHLRSTRYAYPPTQMMLFDMCATLFDERLRRESLIDYRFQSGPARSDCQQYLLYASADRQIAENLAAEGTGLYFRELMPILEQAPNWPPDMQTVVNRLEQRFDELRSKKLTAQEPIYQYWRAPSGKAETKYLGAAPTSADLVRKWAVITTACALPSLFFSEFGIGLAPPWPNRLAVGLGTAPISLLAYQSIVHWSASLTKPLFERWQRWSLAATIVAAVLYLVMFVQFTYPLPDHWHREIGGFTYTPKAAKYREMNPGIPDRDLIQDMGNDVEKVYGNGSLSLMRIAIVGCWLLLFVAGSSFVSLMLVSRPRVRGPGEIRSVS